MGGSLGQEVRFWFLWMRCWGGAGYRCVFSELGHCVGEEGALDEEGLVRREQGLVGVGSDEELDDGRF